MKRYLTIIAHSIFYLVLCSVAYGQHPQAVINVPGDQPTIQAGINAASDGDVVLVAEGTYLENINFKGKAITVASHFLIDGDTSHISATTINGSQPPGPNRASVVTFNTGEDTTSVLCGFTITGGTGSRWAYWDMQVGGGIWIEGGATIHHNYIVNNNVLNFSREGVAGGGIAIQTGYPTALPNGHVIVKNNKIANNSCNGSVFVGGGGIGVLGYGITRISGNTITQNTVSAVNPLDWVSGGGGVFIWEATLDIIKNVISKNDAPFGGGIAASSDVFGFNLRLINNTITDNNSTYKGGGVYLFNGYCNAMNNIFWGNTAPEDSDILYRGNLKISYSITQGDFSDLGTGNLQTDPLFANSTYHLSDASPAIDGGDPDPGFNDPSDPNNPGQPLWPAKGTLRADMGGFGGNDTVKIAPVAYPAFENFQYRQFGDMHYRFAYPLNYDSTLSYPLTIVLHGADAWGTDNDQQLFIGLPWRVCAEYFGYDEFTIVPQSPSPIGWNSDNVLQTVYDLIQSTIANYPIDTTRIVVTGHSRGGGGTWRMLNLYPNFFTAGIPMAGSARGFGDIKHMPVWVHCGTADDLVSVSRDYIARFEATGLTAMYAEDLSDSEIQAAIDNHARLFYSEYVGAGHFSYHYPHDNFYMFEWLKKLRRPVIRPLHSTTSANFNQPVVDSIGFTTRFSNPHNLAFESQVVIENFEKMKLDTLPLFDDGLHGDSLANDGLYGNYLSTHQMEESFRLGVQVNNTALGDTFYFHDLAAFSTKGPLTVDHYKFFGSDTIPNPGDILNLQVFMKNNGINAPVNDLQIGLNNIDTCVLFNPTIRREITNIQPGEVNTHGAIPIRIETDCSSPRVVSIEVKIFKNQYLFWVDTLYIDTMVGLEPADGQIPDEYKLSQNYPNPFNPGTTIEFALPYSGWVTLKIYNALGQEVAVLVAENMVAGTYKYDWNASGLSSGVYFYRLETGEFSATKKLLFLQ
ncbi:MAG: T9SS type A sorting domain-containing protein [Calditrichaeota bacterium]|nr:T9SS type A sorting domain-containing protein [Calditrichota bacterium]MCB0270341.1 T9SS type A sorting domain-containing protein [Calditrichota bacterium]